MSYKRERKYKNNLMDNIASPGLLMQNSDIKEAISIFK